MSSRRPVCGPASVDLAGERDRTSRGARRAPFAKTDLRAVAELAGVLSSVFSLTWGHPHWACTTRSHGTAVLSQTDAAFQRRQALGGLDPNTAKLLDGLARGDKPGADGPRRLKSGTVLVREYQGERHTVTVVPGGYMWRKAMYPSLSTIARAITCDTPACG
jgi:hypothetical protein